MDAPEFRVNYPTATSSSSGRASLLLLSIATVRGRGYSSTLAAPKRATRWLDRDRLCDLNVACRISSSQASALLLDHWGSEAHALGPALHEVQDQGEPVFHTPQFVVIQVPDMFTEVPCVDSPDHLTQDLSLLSIEFNLGMKAGRRR